LKEHWECGILPTQPSYPKLLLGIQKGWWERKVDGGWVKIGREHFTGRKRE
jgi:hypothetical protein